MRGRLRFALVPAVTVVLVTLVVTSRATARSISGALTVASSSGASAPGSEVFHRGNHAGGTSTLPTGFVDKVVFAGLQLPTVVQFSRDGRVFVGEKGGRIEVFDGLKDPTPTTFADLSTNVYDYGDRGLLGLALDPGFPRKPYVYVLYTLDAPEGQDPPVYHDDCGDPQAACVAAARLSRLTEVSHDQAGPERVLIEGWCQQFPSHSIGTLTFGPDHRLYVGAGDAASFNYPDYGQYQHNPCKDPGGDDPTPPTAEGGALRSQDLRTGDDPATLDGAILRVLRNGKPAPDNPLIGGDPSDDRIIAEGVRNPYRFVFRPGSTQVYIGDVGWNTWEEIDVLGDPADPVVENYGWPCYEGPYVQSGYANLGLDICTDLYADKGAATGPLFVYAHGVPIVPGEDCPVGNGSVISAIGFYGGGSYPGQYDGALFFGDVARNCFWVIYPGADGTPDPSTVATFETHTGYPVDLKTGPGGDLFYVDIYGGRIHRIKYAG
jgi:glucose/arabinose dehydrogenase